MTRLSVLQRDRRLWLMIGLTLLALLTGFGIGQAIGYRNGRADTLEEIEQKLSQPKQEPLPTPA